MALIRRHAETERNYAFISNWEKTLTDKKENPSATNTSQKKPRPKKYKKNTTIPNPYLERQRCISLTEAANPGARDPGRRVATRRGQGLAAGRRDLLQRGADPADEPVDPAASAAGVEVVDVHVLVVLETVDRDRMVQVGVGVAVQRHAELVVGVVPAGGLV